MMYALMYYDVKCFAVQCVNSLIYFLDEKRKNRLSVNATNIFGDTALHIAAVWGYSEFSLITSLFIILF